MAYIRLASAPSLAGQLRVANLASHAVTSLHGGVSNPVWGPATIALAVVTARGQSASANIALIEPDGTHFRRLTDSHDASGFIFGFEPVAWSANGARLLASYGGGRVTDAYAIDPVGGDARLIAPHLWPFALSRDGRYVTGQTSVAESDGFLARSSVLRVPWAGGEPHVLLRHAMNPSLSG